MGLIVKFKGVTFDPDHSVPTPVEPVFPDDYTPLQYVESDGSCYIDTGIKCDGDCEITIDIEVTDTDFWVIFGTKADTDKRSPHIVKYQGAVRYTQGSVALPNGQPLTLAAGRNTIVVTSTGTTGSVKIGSAAVQSWTFVGSNATGIDLLLLTAEDGTPHTGPYTRAKIYGFSYKKGGVEVSRMVPYRNPQGRYGLYDTVRGRFYAGTGGELTGR